MVLAITNSSIFYFIGENNNLSVLFQKYRTKPKYVTKIKSYNCIQFQKAEILTEMKEENKFSISLV